MYLPNCIHSGVRLVLCNHCVPRSHRCDRRLVHIQTDDQVMVNGASELRVRLYVFGGSHIHKFMGVRQSSFLCHYPVITLSLFHQTVVVCFLEDFKALKLSCCPNIVIQPRWLRPEQYNSSSLSCLLSISRCNRRQCNTTVRSMTRIVKCESPRRAVGGRRPAFGSDRCL